MTSWVLMLNAHHGDGLVKAHGRDHGRRLRVKRRSSPFGQPLVEEVSWVRFARLIPCRRFAYAKSAIRLIQSIESPPIMMSEPSDVDGIDDQ
jgi:hypothetical protein